MTTSTDPGLTFPDVPLEPDEGARLAALLHRRRHATSGRWQSLPTMVAQRFRLLARLLRLLPPGFGQTAAADSADDTEVERDQPPGAEPARDEMVAPPWGEGAAVHGEDQPRLRRAAKRLQAASPRVVDPPVLDRIGRILRRPLPPVQLHTGPAADELARAAGADALAYPGAVVFREGAYRPERVEGAALLAHELAHVAVFEARDSSVPPAAAAIAAEERMALATERATRASFRATRGDRVPDAAITAEEGTALATERATRATHRATRSDRDPAS
ncbi:MAG: DUF4157 domain-containing protein, partial [Chloroflexales bacterium]|nr:DUF4157 domain-containing protein [Chloroflexales bacterium]